MPKVSIPKVSVIVPAFNAERTLAAAVASALAQTMPDLEILVVDDASSDGTPALAEALASGDPRIRVLRREVNRGPGAARNAGLDAATGEWVALLDADDAYRPNRLQSLLDAAAQYRADLVADNLMLVQVSSTDPDAPMFAPSDLAGPLVLDAATFVGGNLRGRGRERREYGYLKPIIHRPFLASTGIRYEPLRFSEDYLFVLRCLVAGARYVVLPDALYDYTVSAAGLTVGHSAQDLIELARIERAFLDEPRVRDDASLQDAIRRHVHAVEMALGWFSFAQALKQRRPAAAAAEALRSPAHLRHISAEGLRAIPRAIPRALAHLRPRTPA